MTSFKTARLDFENNHNKTKSRNTMSLSINTTVPSAPSTESTPMSNTLNDGDEVELMMVNSPATTIRELHDRAAASGIVISLESPVQPPPPPLEGGGGGQDQQPPPPNNDGVVEDAVVSVFNGATEDAVVVDIKFAPYGAADDTSLAKSLSTALGTVIGTVIGYVLAIPILFFIFLQRQAKDLWNKKSDKSTKDSNSEYQPELSDVFAYTVLVVLFLLPLYSL